MLPNVTSQNLVKVRAKHGSEYIISLPKKNFGEIYLKFSFFFSRFTLECLD